MITRFIENQLNQFPSSFGSSMRELLWTLFVLIIIAFISGAYFQKKHLKESFKPFDEEYPLSRI